MKALMGKIAEKIREDSKGKKGLRDFIISGKNEDIITLESGKKYKVSRDKPTNEGKQKN
jgi:hypothetical protein